MPEYDFYTDTYRGGMMQEGDFARLEARAGAVIERYEQLFTVAYPTPQSRDMAVCAIAEELQRTEAARGENGTAPVSSVSVGSVSTSYNTQPATEIIAREDARIYKAFSLYATVYRGTLAPKAAGEAVQ